MSNDDRSRTDTRLGEERSDADAELLARAEALVEDAEAIVATARARAGAVLAASRRAEDAHLGHGGATTEARAGLARDRAAADAALADEHACVAATQDAERAALQAALDALLARTRGATDVALGAERQASDEVTAGGQALLAQVAHDLRGLLGVIMASAACIPLAPDLAAAATRAGHIERVAGAMADLLDELVDVDASRAGALRLQHARGDLVALAREVVALHAPAAHARGLALGFAAEQEALPLVVDERRLRRVLGNLIGNALKFTPAGGAVTVRVAAAAGEAELAVVDTGVGVPPAEREAIFARFASGQRGGGAHAAGAGLGLYIARQIVEAHGGRIWVEGLAGAGATFRLRLPLVGRALGRARAAAAPADG